MYNRGHRCWESASYEEALLIWCREPFNRDNPQALFILADSLLAQAEKGKETAEAVYQMERAAKLDWPEAALAMGQMFRYGWGVHKSLKTALEWYERAAELGNGEAAAFVQELKRRKKRRTVAAVAVVALILAGVLGISLLPSKLSGPQGILVHEETELIEAATMEEFTLALNKLLGQYDDELMVSGQLSTNRLLLKFEGEGIDLSDFLATTVLADKENFLIIQFASEEEAQRCLKELQERDSVLFVDMDDYKALEGTTISDVMLTSTGVPYRSAYTGYSYYSWGVEYLGLDKLAAWLQTQRTTPVTVAVLDTGTEPCHENADRILKGINLAVPGGVGWEDNIGHGTHVAGTILDCTWGLDVSILPVQVFTAQGYAPESYLVLGLQYAMQNTVDVINLSLGRTCSSATPDGSCSSAQAYYVEEAVAQGIVVVVSAGNGDEYGNPVDTAGECPAHIENCIVVAACDIGSQLASFSNYGDSVDVCAPGVEVVSYYPGNCLKSLSGTSMAAPHISALAAMMKLYLPDRTPAQIEKYITDYCIDQGDTQGYGAGIPWAGYLAGG